MKVRRIRYIMPEPYVYMCPKLNKLVKSEMCKECEYFKGEERYRPPNGGWFGGGTWIIMCDYPSSEEGGDD